MWKFKSWKGKDKWLFLLTMGVILCILAFPTGKSSGSKAKVESQVAGIGNTAGNGADYAPGSVSENGLENDSGAAGGADALAASSKAVSTYEEQMEQRVKDILKNVDGVGEVEVMIVLKSSAQKVIHVDGSSSRSTTEETDASGGARKIASEEQESSTVLTTSDGNNSPIVEKELYPEISGIVISAAGGGSPRVQEEISSAMQALFDLPAHKIKVLKRVE